MIRGNRPNARKHHDPAPAKIRALVLAIGMGVEATAKRIGVSRATLSRYMSGEILAPYPVQYILEALAWARAHDSDQRRTKKKPAGEPAVKHA